MNLFSLLSKPLISSSLHRGEHGIIPYPFFSIESRICQCFASVGQSKLNYSYDLCGFNGLERSCSTAK
ncbi:Uncharacterized protein TCM_029882 [Theobroma cacao]|uniref:Uncharacterized protein n=1 Tax=Theobroma cacao TaxID=3641 RepID=A0A061GGI4_THECC|nr:Uncharacterized protein TCM_029882 [Theobroma cacao]